MQAVTFYNQLGQLPIVQAKNKKISNILSIFELGDELKLTSYDAAYLDLALAHNIPIATLDKQLRLAAQKCGISIFAC